MAANKRIIWILVAVLATVVWGLSFIAQVDGSEVIGKFWFNGLRFFLGGTVLIIPALIFERKAYTGTIFKSTLWRGAVTGIFLFIASNFQQLGVEITKSSGISAFITDLYTLLVPVILFLVFRDRIRLNQWLGVIIALAGLYVLCILNVKTTGFYGELSNMLLGEGSLVLCAIFYAVHMVVVAKLGGKVPPILYSIVQFLTIGVVSVPFALIAGEPLNAEIISGSWMSIGYCGLFSVGVGYTCQMLAQKQLDSTLCALIFPLESVFSMIFGVLFGLDPLTILGVIGCVMILGGIVLGETDFDKFRKKA